jgi:hypothetical protein
MCWYIGVDEEPARFSTWLLDDGEEEEFTITSSCAYVASTIVSCGKCRSKIEAICIHCETLLETSRTSCGHDCRRPKHPVARLSGDGSVLLGLPKRSVTAVLMKQRGM